MKILQMHLEEEPASSSQKSLSLGITCTGVYELHSHRTSSTDALQAPQLGHSCNPPLLARLPNSSNCPWVPEQNF